MNASRAALVLLVAAGPAAAGAPTERWEALAPPSARPIVDVVGAPDGLWVVDEAGGAWRLDGDAWSVVATAPGGRWDGVAVGSGAAWLWQDEPPQARPLVDGVWGPAEAIGDAPLTGLAIDRAGRAYASASEGVVWARAASRWVALGGRGRGRSVWPGPFGVFVGTETGLVAFDGADATLTTEWPAGGMLELLATADGVPLLGHTRLTAWVDGAFVPLGHGRVEQLVCAGSSCWARGPDGWLDHLKIEVEGGAATATVIGSAPPTPSPPLRLAAVGGSAVALLRDRSLVRTAPEPGVALVDASDRARLGLGGERAGGAAGDLDGDGLDDVLLFGPEAVTYLQRGGALVPVGLVGLDAEALAGAESVAVCDVDGNGRADVIAWTGGRLRLLRSLPGRFVDGSARSGLDAVAPGKEIGAIGRIGCDDVDADGDLDLLVAGRFASRSWLLRNDGVGSFSPVDDPLLNADGHVTAEIVAADLDGDGHRDLVFGDQLVGGGALVRGPVTAPTAWPTPPGAAGWADRALRADLDANGVDDVALVDRRVGLRWLVGDPPAVVDAPSASWGGGPAVAVAVDLTRDGAADLVACGSGEGRPCRLWASNQRGPRDASVALPLLGLTHAGPAIDAGPRVLDLIAFDLAGDGDADLLAVRQGPDLVLESVGPSVAPAAAWRGPGLWRRVWWMTALDGAVLGLGAVGLIGVVVWARRRGVVGGVGSARGGLVGAAALVAGWLVVAEWAAAWRVGVPVVVEGLAVVAAVVGVAGARRRAARRVGGYRLERLLGAGGMGRVYVAVDEVSGARLALKLVNAELLDDPDDRALFQREAEIGARVEDPRLVRIHGWGEWTVVVDGQPRPTAYLVMDLVHGATVRELLTARGALPVPEAVAIVREVALGVAALHRVGIVHRDLKPENVMVCDDGSVRVMDFGAARGVGEGRATGRHVLGTLGYLPPEQARGGPVTGTADVFALGVTLYELIAGRRPNVVGAELTPLADRLPAPIWALLVAATHPQPERRPDAQGFADLLAPFASAPKPLVGARPQVTTVATTTDEAPDGTEVRRTAVEVWRALARLRAEQAPVGPELLAAEVLRSANLEALDPATRRLVVRRLEETVTALGVAPANGTDARNAGDTWLTPGSAPARSRDDRGPA